MCYWHWFLAIKWWKFVETGSILKEKFKDKTVLFFKSLIPLISQAKKAITGTCHIYFRDILYQEAVDSLTTAALFYANTGGWCFSLVVLHKSVISVDSAWMFWQGHTLPTTLRLEKGDTQHTRICMPKNFTNMSAKKDAYSVKNTASFLWGSPLKC